MILSIGILVSVFLFGGSSRADAFSQFFARASAILFGAGALLMISRVDLRKIRTPMLLCTAWAGLMVLQLIPLPPDLWIGLPGRERFAELATLAGIAQPWRPLSLVPEATANSALAMLVPLAVLLTVCQVPARRMRLLLMTLVGFALVSGLIGVAQVAAGGASYFYEISNRGDGVGLFANRNHQAAMLAATVPLLAGLAFLEPGDSANRARGTFALVVVVLIFPLVFVTGSRAGVLLLAAGIVFAALILLKMRRIGLARGHVRKRHVLIGIALAIVAAGAALVLFRVGAVDRLLSRGIEDDLRVSLFGSVIDIARLYFPAGGGFGAFPVLYKVDEPFSWLNYRYFNHAHNDLVEIVVEGGLPALILVLAFFGWFARASWRIWRAPFSYAHEHLFGLIGSASLLMLFGASVVDYPLRTPALAAFAAVLAAFIARADMSLSSTPPMVDRPASKAQQSKLDASRPRTAAS